MLSVTLGRPVDFFFRPMELKLEKIEFRKRTSLGKRAENSIKERARDFFERYAEVEEYLGCDRKFVNPLIDLHSSIADPLHPNSLANSPEEAEKLSKILRKEWGLGTAPVPNVHEMLEDHGIKVHEVDSDDERFDGFSAQTNLGPVVVVSKNLNENLLRKRMTLVHELAHIILEIPDKLSRKEKEAITSRFAGAFLLPMASFGREFGKNRKAISLGELAREMNGMLLTGDRSLRKQSETLGIEVHGVLWVLDRLVKFEMLSRDIAI